jgi:transcriptional regulator with XRE-family HTH domain
MTLAERPGAFGVLLRQHRAAAGLSQEELAERAGLSRRGISDLERGIRRAPHAGTVRRLAEAMELDRHTRAELLARCCSSVGGSATSAYSERSSRRCGWAAPTRPRSSI